MVRKLIGEEAFRAGLKSYFEKFAYKNTVGNDLWQELESASGQPIVNLMNAWISQPGLPVVSVSNSHDAAILSQERFFIGKHQPSDALWPIPLFANQPLNAEILDQKEITVSIKKPLQLNCGLSAHFITKYDESTREYLLKNITELPTLDKICILQDATILARAGFENSASLLPLALSLKTETNEKVFDMAAGALTELRKFVDNNDAARDSLKKISREFARATFEFPDGAKKDLIEYLMLARIFSAVSGFLVEVSPIAISFCRSFDGVFLYAEKRFLIISGVSKCLTFALIIKARISVGKSSNLLLSKRVFASFKTSSSSLYIIKLKAAVRRSRSSSDSSAFSSQSNSSNVARANSLEIFFNESRAASLLSTIYRDCDRART
jgi:hypothetical protein